MPAGNWPRAELIAACTSRAAASISRPIANSKVMPTRPWRLPEEMEVTPAMLPRARSSGVATLAAIVSGLAPGSEALTWIVGKSTSGSGATGSRL
jgi:hypothetical protein